LGKGEEVLRGGKKRCPKVKKKGKWGKKSVASGGLEYVGGRTKGRENCPGDTGAKKRKGGRPNWVKG